MNFWIPHGCQVLHRRPLSNHVIRALCRPASTLSPRMDEFPSERIRNFSIIAHIDHGKSTLADRLLEVTGTIDRTPTSTNRQVLDKLKVERDRGITVKAQTASMIHSFDEQNHLLNLIDTPGHVDFTWEVSRSLAACQGALLLVDATQGVQAQSLSVFHVAKEKNLKIVPIINKIDLPQADVEGVSTQMSSMFGLDPSDIICISAKTGLGIDEVLNAIHARIPPPSGKPTKPLRAFLFDSSYDRYRGVISLFSVESGTLRKGDKIASCHTRKRYDVSDVGILHPEEVSTGILFPGQVGYVVCNMKESSEAHIGDTFHRQGEPVKPLEGLTPTKAMVYAGIFPVDSKDFPKLEESIKRLVLTDRSVTVQRESSTALGQGCRLGFLGTLHMDVFRQRLEDEYDANVIITAPTVPYKIIHKDRTITISNPIEFPDVHEAGYKVVEIQEPVIHAKIIVPQKYLGEMMSLCTSHRAETIEHKYLSICTDDSDVEASRVLLTAKFPLSEVVTDFHDSLKHLSSGYASFDYEDAGYETCDMKKMTFLLNGKPIDALAMVVHNSALQGVGRTWAKKLKEVIPRHLFEVVIQAAVGSKVIARETLSAMRKDVTAGLYGGHYERKLKHLNRQKEGKKKMKRIGNIELPQAAFYEVLSTRPQK